jgi:putative copper export protein
MGVMKIIIVLGIVAVLACLAAAGYFMLRRSEGEDEAMRSRRMARALALRVGLSILLFVLIVCAYLLGYIQPNGLPVTAG